MGSEITAITNSARRIQYPELVCILEYLDNMNAVIMLRHMKCKLCLQNKKLQKKSHIIPDFMYKELYDAGHNLYQLSTVDPTNTSSVPTGEYEANILCNDCDRGIIGNIYEDYGSKILYENKKLNVQKVENKDDGMSWLIVKNIDYTKFKLFLISILWRSSITSRKFFDDVKLGPHEEIMREMIIKRNPKEPYEYPCAIFGIRNDYPLAAEIIAQPRKIRKDGCSYYVFFIGGMLYALYISKHNVPRLVLDCAINKSNEMKILLAPKNKGEFFVRRYLGY